MKCFYVSFHSNKKEKLTPLSVRRLGAKRLGAQTRAGRHQRWTQRKLQIARTGLLFVSYSFIHLLRYFFVGVLHGISAFGLFKTLNLNEKEEKTTKLPRRLYFTQETLKAP